MSELYKIRDVDLKTGKNYSLDEEYPYYLAEVVSAWFNEYYQGERHHWVYSDTDPNDLERPPDCECGTPIVWCDGTHE